MSMPCCDQRAELNACSGVELPHLICRFSLPGRVAALNMLAHGVEISTVPYLWTAMFGKSIRYAGMGLPTAAAVCAGGGEATAASLAADPPHQPLPPARCPAWLLRGPVSLSKPVCSRHGVQGQRVQYKQSLCTCTSLKEGVLLSTPSSSADLSVTAGRSLCSSGLKRSVLGARAGSREIIAESTSSLRSRPWGRVR